jgi:hypothetical protein
MTRAIFAALATSALLYMADQEFAGGRFTQAAAQLARQIRHSMGF